MISNSQTEIERTKGASLLNCLASHFIENRRFSESRKHAEYDERGRDYRQRDKGQHICMVALKNKKIRAI